jgi:hypothetical protein
MFRFTIRDVLWLMALVAMGLGWFADNRRRDSVMQAAKLQVEDAEFCGGAIWRGRMLTDLNTNRV